MPAGLSREPSKCLYENGRHGSRTPVLLGGLIAGAEENVGLHFGWSP